MRGGLGLAAHARGVGSGLRVQGSGCRVWGSGSRVQGSECRVWGVYLVVQHMRAE